MKMRRRGLYILFHIDANLINARQKLSAVNQLERWFENEVIMINISDTARLESMAGNYTTRIRKANQQIYTTTPPGDATDPLFLEIGNALFPDGPQNDNQKNDIRIVFEAAKYAAILITGDGGSKRQPGGVLGNRHKLEGIVKILSPDEAVEFVKRKIMERDEFNIRVAKEFGRQLPEWTGID